MQQFKPLKFLIALLPLLEIAGFIIVGRWIGVLATLFLIIATTALGLFVLRVQGFQTLMNMQRRVAAGEHPAIDMLDGSLMMLGGLLLVLPGFITDTIGLLFLIPGLRLLILRWLIKKGAVVPKPMEEQQKEYYGRVIDADFKREDDK